MRKDIIIKLIAFLAMVFVFAPTITVTARPLWGPDDIMGTVFNDLNSNGVMDGAETGLGGITVQLTNPLGGTVSQSTAGNGTYLFTLPDVLSGTHTIEVTVPGGYTPTGATTLNVNKTIGVESSSNDFGLAQVPTVTPTPTTTLGAISGYVYNDVNRNGIRDIGEPGIAGVQVNLSGPSSAGATSGGGGGYFIFTGLTNGVYSVHADWSALGYDPVSSDTQSVLVSGGSSINDINFGGVQTSTATPTSTPTSTPTATTQARSVTFGVDDSDRTIKEGKCVEFYWSVAGDISNVTFGERNGNIDAVNSVEDDRKECPKKSTAYELIVRWADNSVNTRSIEITVEPKVDDTSGSTPAPNATATPGAAGSAALVVSPNQGRAGESFTLVGSGFGENESISVALVGPEGGIIGLPAQKANNSGSFAFSYTTKVGDPIGLYTMVTEGQSTKRRVSAAFFVEDAVTPTPVAVVIRPAPDGSVTGEVIPAAISDSSPLLENKDPLLANIQVVSLDHNTGTTVSTTTTIKPGQGGKR